MPLTKQNREKMGLENVNENGNVKKIAIFFTPPEAT